jgi:HSP20 family protein
MAAEPHEKKKGIRDLLDTLNGLLDLANSLQERGDEGINRTGEFKTDSGLSARYGVHLKSSIGRGGIPSGIPGRTRPEQFGAGPSQAGQTVRPEAVIELPPVEVLQDGDQLTVISEMPGVSEQSIKFDVQGRDLVLTASRKGSLLEQRVRLPFEVSDQAVSRSYTNGIFSLVLRRAT